MSRQLSGNTVKKVYYVTQVTFAARVTGDSEAVSFRWTVIGVVSRGEKPDDLRCISARIRDQGI